MSDYYGEVVTPAQVPDVRLAVLRSWQDPRGTTWGVNKAKGKSAEEIKEMASLVTSTLNDATLYYLTEDAVDLVAAAARTFPLDAVPPRPPLGSGFVVCAREVSTSLDLGEVDGSWAPVDAVQWITHPESRLTGYSVYVNGGDWWVNGVFGVDHEVSLEANIETWRGLRGGADFGYDPGLITRTTIAQAQAVTSIFALLNSPGILRQDPAPIDRAARRRSTRSGVNPTAVNAVRIIKLGYGHSSSDTSSTEGRAYHHRWIVRGHWRSQPYGEGRKLRRPVWISPHVKGPEGAPLLQGEKVNVI